MVTKLSDLDIDEVSLVDIPANNKKIIYKSKNGDKMSKKLRKEKLLEDKKDDDELEEEGLPKHPTDAPKHPAAAAVSEAAAEHRDAARAARHEAELREAVSEAVDELSAKIGDAIASTEEKKTVYEAETDLSGEKDVPPREMSAVPGTPAPEVPTNVPAQERKESSDANIPVGGLEGEIDAPADEYEDESEEDEEYYDDGDDMDTKKECIGKINSNDVEKSSKVSRTQVDLQKALAERDAKIAQLEKAALDAKNTLIEKEYIEKATKEYSHLPGASSEQLGKILKHASDKMSPEMFGALTTVLKASEALLAGSILTQTVGVKVSSAAGADSSAAARLNAKAMEIMNEVHKNQGEKLTFEKAYMRAMKENPKLYDEYLAENRYI